MSNIIQFPLSTKRAAYVAGETHASEVMRELRRPYASMDDLPPVVRTLGYVFKLTCLIGVIPPCL